MAYTAALSAYSRALILCVCCYTFCSPHSINKHAFQPGSDLVYSCSQATATPSPQTTF
jgi:hypothetical protein